jgi:hypothetical protein
VKTARVLGPIAALALAGSAAADPVLQFDVNAFNAQAENSSGASVPFAGLMHTGSVNFSVGAGMLAGMFIQTTSSGPFNNAGLSGFTMSSFTGQINLTNGMVTGGNITLTLNNGDHYTTSVVANSGAVTNFVGGGFKIQALTDHGFFNDATFGNVNVSQFFNFQGVNGLPGSFLQFNFQPNGQGFASSDMDMFVTAIPLPSAAISGLAGLGVLACVRRIRRR